MFINVDFTNELAIYDQIVRQIKFAVAGGILKAGDMLPSVRELARELTLNPNTVARAYRELQTQNIVVPIRGTGLAVAQGADELCARERVELIRTRLRQVLLEAYQSRLQLNDIQNLVQEEWEKLEVN